MKDSFKTENVYCTGKAFSTPSRSTPSRQAVAEFAIIVMSDHSEAN